MSGLMLCTMQAKKPYYIKEINRNIYSVEELCYYFNNYLYLLDDKFFGDALIDYLENTLGLKSIADGLKHLTERGGSLGEKISFVVKNAGYYSQREVDELERHLVMLGSKTSSERLKAKADILMENGNYNLAIVFYRNLLNKGNSAGLPETFYGSVYNNLGAAYAGMFEYTSAAACFRSAYAVCKDPVILDNVIKADLMGGNDEKLVNDRQRYRLTDVAINRIKEEIEALQKEAESAADLSTSGEFIKNCKLDYLA